MESLQQRPARPPRQRVDGVLLVDKPKGLTSNAVLQRVKRAYNALKAGHTGTLDPLASGLLPICLGEATKFSIGLLDADKRYRATLHLGISTETGDTEGPVSKTRAVATDRSRIDQAIRQFTGDILQVPHRYSALKRDGRALYSYARAGEIVTIAARSVRILQLLVEEWSSPFLTINVLCSKGTYIRSLGEDIGEALGCGAHVSALRRLTVGNLSVDRALSLEAIEAGDEHSRAEGLLPIRLLVAGFPRLDLDVEATAKFRQGQRVTLAEAMPHAGQLVAVFGRHVAATDGLAFLGVGKYDDAEGQSLLIPARLLATAS